MIRGGSDRCEFCGMVEGVEECFEGDNVDLRRRVVF